MSLLEQHFDVAFAAPDGIKKLRELILTLAMQGKLVPQDPNDEPASELLKEIEAEKKRLLKEGKIRQPKPLPEIKAEEVTHVLPNSWKWVRLGEIVSLLGDGLHGTPAYDETGEYFFINGNNLSDGSIEIKGNTNKVSIDEYNKYKKELNSRTVLVSINGTIGNVAFYNNENVILGKSACYFNLFEPIDKQFTKKLLNSLYFLEYAFSSATGSTIKNVSLKAMREFLVPLPPLAEQRRIVAKIDQLMARCDELEKLRVDRSQRLLTVHTAALDRLLTAEDSSEFSTAWSFITQHFGELYSVKENVVELRKTILQLAVMGKLVPQDPNDEPASELLRSIEFEKQRLVKEGKIKKSKPLPEIDPEELLYQLPKGSAWVRLGDMAQIIGGFAYKSNLFKTEGNKQVLRLGNIRPDLIRLNENPVFIDDLLADTTSELCLQKNDILITMTGTRAKRDYLYTVCVEENPINGISLYVNQRVGVIRLFFNAKYINLALKVEILKYPIFSSATGSANQANIGISNLREWIIPLPPLAEQGRIVEKIDRLMGICDRLEESIESGKGKQTALLNALMSQV